MLLPQIQAQQVKCTHRGHKGFRRHHADLRTRLQVEYGVGKPCDGAGNNIGDGNDRRSSLTRLPDTYQRIRGLARLRHCNA